VSTTQLERESLEAHVDLCAIRYEQLESRLDKVEGKIDILHTAISAGQQSMTKVIIGAAGTVVAGLLSTVVVILMNM
jgi:tetrahydromethanopterin S-methyltransferase subunit G